MNTDEVKYSSFSRSFLYGRWRLTKENAIFASLYHLFCGFKNAQKQPCVCVLQKMCFSKWWKIYRKTGVPESVFNKVKLATALKNRLRHTCFPVNFSKLLRTTFFIKHLWATVSECWQLEKSSWLCRRYHFSALWRLSFWMIAFSWTFSWDVETLSSNFLLKSEGNH